VADTPPPFQGPIGRLGLGAQVAQTMGWRWIMTRLRLDSERRIGLVRRRSPLETWAGRELAGGPQLRCPSLHPAAAGHFMRDQVPGVEPRLRQRLAELKESEFEIFGTRYRLRSWHEDPLTSTSYPRSVHWSEVREDPVADLKTIWEPSRFTWVFDLARLHALDTNTVAPEVFWSLFDDWCAENQPNAGVNWQCGQEAALRLVAVLFGVFSFGPESLSSDRQRRLANFADVTARRILAHWRYAKSQDNNHIVSEAVGLITVGLVFPDLAVAARARSLGERLLADACQRLVLPDGGTSQYSLNYHRLFMENFIWALWLYRSLEEQPPADLESALRRSRDFLLAITQQSDGAAGNWGNNDGAHLLRLAATHHLDVRPTLLMAAQLLDGATYPWGGPAEEAVRWFWGDSVNHLPPEPAAEPGEVQVEVFPYAGISLIVNGRHRAIVRGGPHQLFRPHQCDFGHVELWVDGEQVVFDPGTYSYKPLPGEPDYAEARWHNMPGAAQDPQMTRLGRFLWGDWPEVAVKVLGDGLLIRVGTSRSSTDRMVLARETGWQVVDDLNCGSRRTTTSWSVDASSLPTTSTSTPENTLTLSGPPRSRYAATPDVPGPTPSP